MKSLNTFNSVLFLEISAIHFFFPPSLSAIHFIGDSCNHWMCFSDATKTKNGWANELLHEFECNVEMLKQAVKDHNIGSPPKSPTQASPQHTQTGVLSITILLYLFNLVCIFM